MDLVQASGYQAPWCIYPSLDLPPIDGPCIAFAHHIRLPAAKLFAQSVLSICKKISVGEKLQLGTHLVKYIPVQLVVLVVWMSGEPIGPGVVDPRYVHGLNENVSSIEEVYHCCNGCIHGLEFGTLPPTPYR